MMNPRHTPKVHLLPQTERQLAENAKEVEVMVDAMIPIVISGHVDASFAAVGCLLITMLSLATEVAAEDSPHNHTTWTSIMTPLRTLADALHAYTYATTPDDAQAAMDAILVAANTEAALTADAIIAKSVRPQ